jgi:hypothetical protein
VPHCRVCRVTTYPPPTSTPRRDHSTLSPCSGATLKSQHPPGVIIRQRLKHHYLIVNTKRVETDHRDCKDRECDLSESGSRQITQTGNTGNVDLSDR